jgi:hypothetical protein
MPFGSLKNLKECCTIESKGKGNYKYCDERVQTSSAPCFVKGAACITECRKEDKVNMVV